MFLLDGPRLPTAHANVKINLKLFERVKRQMIMRICRVSRARALEIIAERAAEKAAKKAEKSAARETFRQRIAERKKHLANCG